MTDTPHTTTDGPWPRWRLLLARQAWVVLAVALLLVVTGAWLGYGALAHPGEQTTNQTETRGEIDSTLTHTAVVENETTLYEADTTLKDQPAYFTAVTPTVEATTTTSVPAALEEPLSVTSEVTLRLASQSEDTVYWEDREHLADENATVAPGESLTTSVAIDADHVRERIDAIESELGGSPGETVVELETEYTVVGDPGDGIETRSLEETVPISVDGATLAFDGSGATAEPIEVQETTTVEDSPGAGLLVGGPVLALVGLLVGVVAVGHRRLSEDHLAWLEYRASRQRNADVIVVASIPGTPPTDTATVESLDALAQLAVDLESIVLFETGTEMYLVPTDGVTYRYDPPSPPSDDSTVPIDWETVSFEDDDEVVLESGD